MVDADGNGPGDASEYGGTGGRGAISGEVIAGTNTRDAGPGGEPPDGGEVLEGSVTAAVTPEQATYLVRWGLGELAVTRLDAAVVPFTAVASLLAAACGLLAAFAAHGAGAAVLIVFTVLFGVSALVTLAFGLAVRRLVRRFAVPPHLRPAFQVLTGVGSRWRHNLRAELRRVGLPDGPFALFALVGPRSRPGRGAARGFGPAELAALREIRLDAVFGLARLREAQRRFEEAQARHESRRG